MDFMTVFELLVQLVRDNWQAFAGLAGLAVFVPALVNLLKTFNVVGEDGGDSVQAVINAVLFVFFVGVRIFFPDFDIDIADSVLMQIGTVIVGILTFLGQFGITKLSYFKVWKGRFGKFGFYHS